MVSSILCLPYSYPESVLVGDVFESRLWKAFELHTYDGRETVPSERLSIDSAVKRARCFLMLEPSTLGLWLGVLDWMP